MVSHGTSPDGHRLRSPAESFTFGGKAAPTGQLAHSGVFRAGERETEGEVEREREGKREEREKKEEEDRMTLIEITET